MKSKSARLFPLDALRGLIIVFMALDHANYFIAQKHSSGEHWGGPFPAYDSPLPFLTRLVTHLSAPGFFFLMGAGMFLFAASHRKQGWNEKKILGHFWVRGLILIALQFLVVNFAWKSGPGSFPETYIGVLVALGGTMIIGSLFLRLKPPALLILTLGLLAGTEWLHPDPEQWGRLNNEPWNLFLMHSGGDGSLWSNYPILPWLELVVFGIVFGHWLSSDEQGAYRKGFWLGAALLVLFVIIRYMDGFGNIRPRAGDTWIDFLNIVKYPPSMVFTFLTMGVNLIVLLGFSRAGKLVKTISKPLVTFGSEPLFVYVIHLFLYMLLGKFFTPQGTSLPAMFPFWLAGLLLLYPITSLYKNFKKKQSPLSIFPYI